MNDNNKPSHTIATFRSFHAGRRPSASMNEFRLFEDVVGVRFDHVRIHASLDELATPTFTRWVRETIKPRLSSPFGSITIEVES